MAKRITAQEAQEIHDLAAQGWTPSAIARCLGRSPTSLCGFFDREGIPRTRNRKRRQIADEDVTKFISIYETENRTLEQIATAFDTDTSTVYRRMRERGFDEFRTPGAPLRFTDEVEKQAIIEAYTAGFSANFLAARYDCSPDAINRVLDDADIKRRSLNETMALRWYDERGREHYMRSSWEICTAQWFDNAGRAWDYEVESFALRDVEGRLRHYTPDFWLYADDGSLEKIIEIKGWLSEEAERRIELFRATRPDLKFEVWREQDLLDLGVLNVKLPRQPESFVWTGSGSRLSNKERLRIVDLYDQHHTMKQISEMVGRSTTAISNYLHLLDKVRSTSEAILLRVSDEARSLAFRLYQEREPYKDIAKQTGMSQGQVRAEIERRGGRLRRRDWDNREDTILREHYDGTKQGLSACVKLLPNRGINGIRCRSKVLGLTKTRQATGAARRAVSPEQAETANQRHQKGESWKTIAQSLGVSRPTLRAAIRRLST
jgi:uncharacterized protein YerC/DNA-binding CsgD family transcriptional regulator